MSENLLNRSQKLRDRVFRFLEYSFIFLVSHASVNVFAANEEELYGLTGTWGGKRKELHGKGIDITSFVKLDDTWNLAGGKKRSDAKGNFEYVFDITASIKSDHLLHYSGGKFLADFRCHHGKDPNNDVGAIVEVDEIAAPSFNEIYALWYQQSFADGKHWFLIGKSDAYDHFTCTEHSNNFINGSYSDFPTILFFPTYPDPAMSVVVSLGLYSHLSLTMGVFDGSTALGRPTGKHGVVGSFFNHLSNHAFLIAELRADWEIDHQYPGEMRLGGWKHTAKFEKFSGGKQKGTSAPYATLDQVIYKNDVIEGALFFILSWGNPNINEAQAYYSVGTSWTGIVASRPRDNIGLSMSATQLSHEADFTKSYEIAYEAFYQFQIASWGYLQPDYQYIVHPGGNNFSNGSVFTFRFYIDF